MMLTVVEYWKKEYQDKWYVYFVSDGTTQDFPSEQEANAMVESRRSAEHQRMLKEGNVLAQLENVQVQYAIRKRRVPVMKMAVKAGDVILTQGLQPSPFEPYYHGFPWFQYIAEWSPEAKKEELRVQGLVRSLKDPQQEVNKSRSQYLHILNTSANSGWIGDEDALTEEKWMELKEFGATPGIAIRKKKGSQLDRIHPVEPAYAHQVREKAAEDDFKQVSGINADLLSVDSSADPSGKAIALRIRQAVTILQPSFENFRYTKILIGQFLFKIIPSMFDVVKVEKILGQEFMQANQLTRGTLQAYMNMIEDGKYNVSISEAHAGNTMREETFEDLMTLVEKGMPLPPDLIVEYMNIPNKQEIINKMTQFQQQQAAMQQQAGASPR
jgi:hypothetical protein